MDCNFTGLKYFTVRKLNIANYTRSRRKHTSRSVDLRKLTRGTWMAHVKIQDVWQKGLIYVGIGLIVYKLTEEY